jgi:hypothetical protein
MKSTATEEPTMAATNDTALAAYLAAQAAAAELLLDITEALDEHHGVAPEQINWGHVGDVNAVVEQLTAIKNFIAGDVA